jgi:hypothetical protein
VGPDLLIEDRLLVKVFKSTESTQAKKTISLLKQSGHFLAQTHKISKQYKKKHTQMQAQM